MRIEFQNNVVSNNNEQKQKNHTHVQCKHGPDDALTTSPTL